MNNDTFICDFCEVVHPLYDRVVVALPQPSSPDTIVAVMWGCGLCEGSVMLPSASLVFDTIEDTGEWQGTAYLFVSV